MDGATTLARLADAACDPAPAPAPLPAPAPPPAPAGLPAPALPAPSDAVHEGQPHTGSSSAPSAPPPPSPLPPTSASGATTAWQPQWHPASLQSAAVRSAADSSHQTPSGWPQKGGSCPSPATTSPSPSMLAVALTLPHSSGACLATKGLGQPAAAAVLGQPAQQRKEVPEAAQAAVVLPRLHVGSAAAPQREGVAQQQRDHLGRQQRAVGHDAQHGAVGRVDEHDEARGRAGRARGKGACRARQARAPEARKQRRAHVGGRRAEGKAVEVARGDAPRRAPQEARPRLQRAHARLVRGARGVTRRVELRQLHEAHAHGGARAAQQRGAQHGARARRPGRREHHGHRLAVDHDEVALKELAHHVVVDLQHLEDAGGRRRHQRRGARRGARVVGRVRDGRVGPAARVVRERGGQRAQRGRALLVAALGKGALAQLEHVEQAVHGREAGLLRHAALEARHVAEADGRGAQHDGQHGRRGPVRGRRVCAIEQGEWGGRRGGGL